MKNITKFFGSFWLTVVLIFFPLSSVNAYGSQSAYYTQSTYYSQSYYQSSYNLSIRGGNSSVTGNFAVTGAIGKGSGTFVIDHPLDPANKLLYHSFVESPDVKNIYDGIATLDQRGEVVVKLPDYFEALNGIYRYQFTALGEPSPGLYIKEEIANDEFLIAGGIPGAMVSWQVTGIRHDHYILKNPIIPEVEKGPNTLVNKGEYLFSEFYENETIDEASFDESLVLRLILNRVSSFFSWLWDII